MYLSRLFLASGHREVLKDLGDPRGLHRRVMRSFPGPASEGESGRARASHGVLHRVDIRRETGRAILYVQSESRPDFGHLPEGYLLDLAPEVENPAVRSVDEAWAALREGQTLSFVLRANPSRKIGTKTGEDGQRQHGQRVPVRGDEGRLAWLVRQGERGGFSLKAVEEGSSVLDVRVGEEPRQRDQKARETHGKAGVTLNPVLYEGRLVVVDPARFRQTLKEGIGPSKAFGCGLLSIAP